MQGIPPLKNNRSGYLSTTGGMTLLCGVVLQMAGWISRLDAGAVEKAPGLQMPFCFHCDATPEAIEEQSYNRFATQGQIQDAWAIPSHGNILSRPSNKDQLLKPSLSVRWKTRDPLVDAQFRYDVLMNLLDRYNLSAKTLSGRKYAIQLALMDGRISHQEFRKAHAAIVLEMSSLPDGFSLGFLTVGLASEYPSIVSRPPKEYPALDRSNDALGATMNQKGGWRAFMDRHHKEKRSSPRAAESPGNSTEPP